MRRKITYVLCLAMVCLLCACGKSDSSGNSSYNGVSEKELKSQAITSVSDIYYFNSIAEASGGLEMLDKYLDEQEKLSGDSKYKVFASMINSSGILCYASNIDEEYEVLPNWKELIDSYGDVIIDENTGKIANKDFEVTKSGNTLTTDMIIMFEKDGKKTEVTFEMVYDATNMELTGITLNPVESTGAKLAKAGQNTLISLAIVFSVLILISLIIYSFKLFSLFDKKSKQSKKATEELAEAETDSEKNKEVKIENIVNDSELIAVIAAAIAASEGKTINDFVVRSINRR